MSTPLNLADPLCSPGERGTLQVPHLKRCWSRWMAARNGRAAAGNHHEAHRTQIVLAALGVGLEQTM